MSDRIHCDHCDFVIPRDASRLTLRCGIAKGNTWHDEEDSRDYCKNCIEESPVLKRIFDEQFDEAGASRQ